MRPFFQLQSNTPLGKAWSGNSVNCVPFRVAPMITDEFYRFVAFFDGNGDVQIGRQHMADGRIDNFVLENARKPYDAHQSISMGRDAAGRIHLAFGAHASSLLIARSHTDKLEDGFSDPEPWLTKATYPMFLRTASGALLLLFREGKHNSGALNAAEFDNESRTWIAREAPFISGVEGRWSAGPYMNTPTVDEEGRIHLFLVWRLPKTATSAGPVVNVGLDYMASDDELRTLRTLAGVTLTVPVTPVNSERVALVPIGANLINQSSANVLSNGRPAAVTYWDDAEGVPQYKLVWHDARQWRISVVSAFTSRFRLDADGTLPLPHGRPEFVVDEADNVILIYRSREEGGRLIARKLSPPDYKLSDSRSQILVDEDLGFYEPVIDRTAWRSRGELAIYVQSCQQGLSRDGMADIDQSDARILIWKQKPLRAWSVMATNAKKRLSKILAG